jgi:hypothetical protein
VHFIESTVIEEGRDGVWITGPIGEVAIITRGQAYLAEGQAVDAPDKAVEEEAPNGKSD